MKFRELAVPGAWEITPKQFPDPRGVFLEWFKDEAFTQAVYSSTRSSMRTVPVR